MGIRGQSAMEYLSTYGLGILTLSLVLAILYQLGVFNSSSYVGAASCLATAGYQCTSPVLSSNGLATVTFGEIGSTMTISAVACSVNSTAPSSGQFQAISPSVTIQSDQSQVLSVLCPISSNSIGTPFTGSIWIQSTSPITGLSTLKVGSIRARVSQLGQQTTSSSGGALAYLQITLQNSQGSSTGSNFQQMITFNPSIYSANEAAGLGNIRFYISNAPQVAANELYSWCESGCNATSSNAVFWIKIPGGIAANGNAIVNMTFNPLTTVYDGVYAGQAPQIIPASDHAPSVQFHSTTQTAAYGSSGLSMTTSGSGSVWLCGAADNNPDSGLATSYAIDVSDGDFGDTAIGHQSSNTCTAEDQYDAGGYAGVAISLSNAPTIYALYTNSTIAAPEDNLPLLVPTNSFVVIIVACGNGGSCNIDFQNSGSGSVSGIPSGCINRQDNSYDGYESADLWTCNSISGTFQVFANTESSADMSMAAYVFSNTIGYAKYDNGASVFTNYWDFLGTSLPSGWTGSGEYQVNNGLSIAFENSPDSYAYTTSNFGLNANYILEFYGAMPQAESGSNGAFGYVEYNTGNGGVDAGWTINNNNAQAGTLSATGQTAQGGGYTDGTSGGVSATGFNIWQIYFPSSSYVKFSYNYGSPTQFSTTVPTMSYPIGGVNYQGPQQATIGPFYWVRSRVYQPGGVMPAVTFGSVK